MYPERQETHFVDVSQTAGCFDNCRSALYITNCNCTIPWSRCFEFTSLSTSANFIETVIQLKVFFNLMAQQLVSSYTDIDFHQSVTYDHSLCCGYFPDHVNPSDSLCLIFAQIQLHAKRNESNRQLHSKHVPPMKIILFILFKPYPSSVN